MNKKIQNFLKQCKEKKVLVIYDSDLDGVCSGIITLKALKLNKCEIKTITAERGRLQEYINENADINFVVVLDQAPRGLKIPKDKKILVIDHHPSDDESSSKMIHINPTFKKRVYQPTSYLAYTIFSEFFDLKKYEWISVLGTTADYGYDDVKDLMDQHMTVDERDEIWETYYGKTAILLGGAALDIGYEKIFSIISSSKGLDDLNANNEIKRAYKEYSVEYLRCKKIAIQNMENIGKIMFTKISSKYQGVASHISMDIVHEYPNKIVFVAERRDDSFKVSGRTHRTDVDLGKIMKKATKGIGTGGGHAPAAGASVAEDKLDRFKERVIDLVRG